MKKNWIIVMLSFTVLCAVQPCLAQIRVIGSDGVIVEEVAVLPDEVPIPEDLPKKEIREENPGGIDCDPWSPEDYYQELLAKTMDEYAVQTAENLIRSLSWRGCELIQSVTDYTVPALEEIKESFYAQVLLFGLDDVTPDTLLGDFAGQAAQEIMDKIALLSDIEKQVLGIPSAKTGDDSLLDLSLQVIWTLERLTAQPYYDEFYTLLNQYMPVWRDGFFDDPVCLDESGLPVEGIREEKNETMKRNKNN